MILNIRSKLCFLLLSQSLPFVASADTLLTTLSRVTSAGVGEQIGTIEAIDTEKGLELHPNLKGLSPGLHGFHIHENPSCEPKEKEGKMEAAQAAGGHLDPKHSGKHEGPEGEGHLGDLPYLEVAPNGLATKSLLAPRLRVADLQGHSLMIHEGGDNYSDSPKVLGGGGGRIACGVVGK